MIREALAGATPHIAVTGATGWLGAAALDLLYRALGNSAGGHVVAYAGSRRTVTVSDGRVVQVRPLEELSVHVPSPSILLHFAFLTPDRLPELGLDGFVRTNVGITATVLDAVARHRPRALVVASSGAVAARADRSAIDLASAPYGTLKSIDELAFRSAARDVGAACVLPRIYNLAGGCMPRPGSYALGSLMAMAAGGGPLEIHARGPVVRDYCGVEDVVAVALATALAGRDETFDTGGTVIEIADLARLVAREHGLSDTDVVHIRDPAVPEDRYVGDHARMASLAARAGLSLRSLPDLVRETSRAAPT